MVPLKRPGWAVGGAGDLRGTRSRHPAMRRLGAVSGPAANPKDGRLITPAGLSLLE